MANQQLFNYVKQQLQQGKKEDEIKSELLGAGWEEADINQAFGMSSSSQPPRPSTPPVPPVASTFTPTGLQQLDSKAVWVFFLRWVFVFLVIVWFIGGGIMVTLIGWVGSLIGLIIALILAFIWAKLTYHFYRYELTEEGFRKELGVIIKKYVTIPYERIQNVNIERSLLERIFGLSALKIFTAGSGGSGRFGAEGLLPGLSRNTAEDLRNQLVHLSRQTRNQWL